MLRRRKQQPDRVDTAPDVSFEDAINQVFRGGGTVRSGNLTFSRTEDGTMTLSVDSNVRSLNLAIHLMRRVKGCLGSQSEVGLQVLARVSSSRRRPVSYDVRKYFADVDEVRRWLKTAEGCAASQSHRLRWYVVASRR